MSDLFAARCRQCKKVVCLHLANGDAEDLADSFIEWRNAGLAIEIVDRVGGIDEMIAQDEPCKCDSLEATP